VWPFEFKAWSRIEKEPSMAAYMMISANTIVGEEKGAI
jgi:hypothetical protein